MDKISEVAGYLWEKGWAEYNGRNISVNVTASLGEELRNAEPLSGRIALPAHLKLLAGELFYVTGTGKRMRDVAWDLWANGAVIRICDDGRGYEIVYKENIPPTSELAKATLAQLKEHDVVIWEKHGLLAVGDDVVTCFDVIDTLNKAAQIYVCARAAGA